jgi:hypothetical protein
MKIVTLTDFATFRRSSATRRGTIARKCCFRTEYRVEQDFYKRVREKIKALPGRNGDLSELVEVPALVSEKRRGHIRKAVDGFVRWVADNDITFFRAPRGLWEHQDVQVRVNPEVGAVINGVPHLLKVNYTATPTEPADAEMMAQLMHRTCGRLAPRDCRMGVLDVRTGTIRALARPTARLDAVLEGTAAELSSLWNQVETERV